jgi:hypothetical protein
MLPKHPSFSGRPVCNERTVCDDSKRMERARRRSWRGILEDPPQLHRGGAFCSAWIAPGVLLFNFLCLNLVGQGPYRGVVRSVVRYTAFATTLGSTRCSGDGSVREGRTLRNGGAKASGAHSVSGQWVPYQFPSVGAWCRSVDPGHAGADCYWNHSCQKKQNEHIHVCMSLTFGLIRLSLSIHPGCEQLSPCSGPRPLRKNSYRLVCIMVYARVQGSPCP